MPRDHAELRFVRRLLLAVSGIATAAVTALCSPAAQGQSQSATDPPALSFEVAVIKPDHLDGHSSRISYNTNSLVTSGTNLKLLIEFAYHINAFQLSGGPPWVDSETYQVQAKIDQETAEAIKKYPAEQQDELRRVLVQALLADRFKLKVSHSSKELPIYALVLTKNGPKFASASGTGNGMSSRNGELTAKAVTMVRLAEWLSQVVGRTVLDKTALQGKYDFVLSYDARRQALTATDPGQTQAALSDSAGPSIFSALQEQLGLKLESGKGPVPTLIIDSAEKPSPN